MQTFLISSDLIFFFHNPWTCFWPYVFLKFKESVFSYELLDGLLPHIHTQTAPLSCSPALFFISASCYLMGLWRDVRCYVRWQQSRQVKATLSSLETTCEFPTSSLAPFCFSSDHSTHRFSLAKPPLKQKFALKCQSGCWWALMLITKWRPGPVAQDRWSKTEKETFLASQPVTQSCYYQLHVAKDFPPHFRSLFQLRTYECSVFICSCLIIPHRLPSLQQGRPLKQQVKICAMYL